MTTDPFYKDLNPVSFLDRSVHVYPDKPALIYGDITYTYQDFYNRVNKLAGALQKQGIKKGDRVGFLVPNIPAMFEGHYGPLKIGAVLVAINTRLSAREVSYILNHSGAKVLVFDSEYAELVSQIQNELPKITSFVQVADIFPKSTLVEGPEYEEFLDSADPGEHRVSLESESDPITINYTSGTTGMPKGVQYHSRGAYLSALGEVVESGMNYESKYLWTLPMFHCNGWCFTWATTAVGATNICLRRVDPLEVYRLIDKESVTHMCCAPTVLTSMYSIPDADQQDLTGVTIMTAGAPPAPQVIRSMENMGADILHTYGLTETYGPTAICAIQPDWKEKSSDEVANLKARQGVAYVVADTGMRVVDTEMNDVERNGSQMGEVVMSGNMVMSGYFDDEDATIRLLREGGFTVVTWLFGILTDILN